MTLREYIEQLTMKLEEHGDAQCYYASDDEGNDYIRVYYAGTVMYADSDDTYRLESVVGEDDIGELDNPKKIIVIN